MLYLFVACTVTDCTKCPTNKDVCTECRDGKGVDSNGATCTGKFLDVLKCNLFHLIIRTITIIIFVGFVIITIISSVSSSSCSSSRSSSSSNGSSSSSCCSSSGSGSYRGNHCALKTQGFQLILAYLTEVIAIVDKSSICRIINVFYNRISGN